jgi:membrane protease YdiL (CAAX protease family)
MLDVLKRIYLSPEWLQDFTHILAYITFTSVSLILIKANKSNFREYGFLIPEDPGGYLSISLILALVYVLITIFLPGNVGGFEAFPAFPATYVFAGAAESLLASVASESVFRGYIQTNLTKAYGFLQALLISSVMFALCSFSFLSYVGLDTAIVFSNSLFFLFQGIFLGVFFQRTGTLMCPITFYTAVSFMYYFTPLKPVATEPVNLLLKITAYIILSPLSHFLLVQRAKLKQSNQF